MEESRQFNQEEKLVILESAKGVGIKEASRIAGVHYTTVYEWRSRLEVLGRDGFLSYCSESRGRGIKRVTEVQEKAVLDTWERYPGFGPSQMKNPLRRQGVTVSTRNVHRNMEANGYRGNRKKREKETSQRFEALRPLELAQMDILEFFVNQQKVYLLLLLAKSILEKIVSVYIAMRNCLPPLGDRQVPEEIVSHPASPEARQQRGDHGKKRAQK